MKIQFPLRLFTAANLILNLLTTISIPHATALSFAPRRQFYQLLIYHVKDKTQETTTDKYLAESWLPALHRAGIDKIGVFKTLGIDTATDKKIYVLTAYKSLDQFHKVTRLLRNDQELGRSGLIYLDAKFDAPPYLRKESILMEAFTGMPVWKAPDFAAPKSERIYELRSYEVPQRNYTTAKSICLTRAMKWRYLNALAVSPSFMAKYWPAAACRT
jgi:hypothetical protein